MNLRSNSFVLLGKHNSQTNGSFKNAISRNGAHSRYNGGGARLLHCLLFGSVLMICVQLKGQGQFDLPASYKIGELPRTGGSPDPALLWRYGIDGDHIRSNVPLNEISIRAFRQFRKLFPQVSDESWFKNSQGYIVSFGQNSLRSQVYFNTKGAFLYTIRNYGERDMPADLSKAMKKKYPDYRITVITEIMDGEKTLYMVKIENHSSVKTISVIDGRMEVSEDMINGG